MAISNFRQAIPIYAVVVGAVGGAGWYMSRLARGPDGMQSFQHTEKLV